MSALDMAVKYIPSYAGDEIEARKELATLRANQLPANVVAAVRAYQERWRGVDCNRTFSSALTLLEAIEADAKERG